MGIVYYKIKERSDAEVARQLVETIRRKANVPAIDDEMALAAADVHLHEKLSVADAFVYAAAVRLKGMALTGDPHFKGKERVLFID